MARPNPRYGTESDLSATVTQIINAIAVNKVVVPDHFQNNIAWVKTGAITHQAFLDAYNYLAKQAIIHIAANWEATPQPQTGLGSWFFSTPTASGAMLSDSTPFDPPEPEPESKETWWVIRPSGVIEQVTVTQKFVNTMTSQGWIFSKDKPTIEEPQPEPEPESKETWWVIRPSGVIEQVTVTQKFVNTMTSQGWIFSKDKPTIEEPQNQNISIVFYIGKGGDLKTHFGINSIIVTPDEAELLAGWLYQNYNTKILFVLNRLTDDIRTHTLQQIKDLIIQKLKDDEPESDDITPDDIKPKTSGFMAAGAAGAIAGLVLLGFIIDSKVGK